ncbi:peroxiredoxin family protein [Spirosoma telluris]
MRRVLKIGLFLLVAGLIGGAIVKMNQTLSVKQEQAAKRQKRPDLSPIQFTKPTNPAQDMIDGKPTLIILFDPDCEHCQYEAEQLQTHHQAFAKASVYLLTTQTPARAQAFSLHYGLDTLAMMHVGTLTREESYRAFGATSVPHIFIYGSDGQLRKEYKGETMIEALLNAL